MATPTATQQSLLETTIPPAPTVDHRRLMLVRMVATAHLVAGAVMTLSIAGNLALGLDYSGGPIGYYGSESLGMAACLHTLTHLPIFSAATFWERLGGFTIWIYRHAQTSREFFGLMAGVHLTIAGAISVVGYGLWRCLPWARKADLILVGVAAAFATAHGVALLAGGFGYLGDGFQILAITAAVALPILILLRSSKTAALFDPSASGVPVAAQKRRWWTLSAQWLGAVLVCVFALGLVRLFFVGPLVEVVWAAVLFTRYYLGA